MLTISWRIGRRLGAYYKMILIISRGSAHALRSSRFRTISAFQRVSICLRFTTNGQSLDIWGMGTDWRETPGRSARRLVLSDHRKSGLLSRAAAWAGLPTDRRWPPIGPKDYVVRSETFRNEESGRRTDYCAEVSQGSEVISSGTAYTLRFLAVAASLGLSLMAAPAPAQVAPFDDYSKAPSHYFNKANAGNADAQFLLGLALEKLGPAAETRWGAAENWIAKAASAGSPEAQLRYSQIKLAAGNVISAKRLLMDAASSGVPEAQFNLGALAEKSKDAKGARHWYWQAARQNYGPAQYNLALSLINLGGEAALTDALSWLILAAENAALNADAAQDQVKAVLNADAIKTAEKWAAARR